MVNPSTVGYNRDVTNPVGTVNSPPGRLTACGCACVVLWGAVRDGSATLMASLITLGGIMGARHLLSSVPAALHGIGVLTTGLNAVAAGRFGWGVGDAAGGGLRRWAGGAVCAMTSVALNVVAIWVIAKDSPTTAVKLFGTTVYSGLREAIQGHLLKPRLPDVDLRESRSLRWETGRNTRLHVGRLVLQMTAYAGICIFLNGFAQKNVVNPNFNTLDQPPEDFVWESLKTHFLGTLAEAGDAAVGNALLLWLFHPDVEIRSEVRYRVPDPPDGNDWVREASARTFMNDIVASTSSMFGSHWASGSAFAAITTVWEAMANLKPADADLVHRHFQRVMAYLVERQDEPGYERVTDQNPLIAGLPEDVQLELWSHRKSGVVPPDLAKKQWDNAAHRTSLVTYLEAYYREPGRPLASVMAPFLKRERKRALDETRQGEGKRRLKIDPPSEFTLELQHPKST